MVKGDFQIKSSMHVLMPHVLILRIHHNVYKSGRSEESLSNSHTSHKTWNSIKALQVHCYRNAFVH